MIDREKEDFKFELRFRRKFISRLYVCRYPNVDFCSDVLIAKHTRELFVKLSFN